MPDSGTTTGRKSDHLRINLEMDVQSQITTGLESYTFNHEALPEMDLEEVDLTSQIFGRRLRIPLLISSMTGGTPEAERINRRLAAAAQDFGLAMGVGSQRAALEDPRQAGSFKVRSEASDILLFANLGAVQLNHGYGTAACAAAVEMIGADALFLHLNSLQEAIQPEGDTAFGGLLKKIETVCRELSVPVLVKEVGWGISKSTARRLLDCGVAGIDVAGAGGTSWSEVEKHRMENPLDRQIAGEFRAWGIPTAISVQEVRKATPQGLVFGSGGIRSGMDVAKVLALGADLAGVAGPMLVAAHQGERELDNLIESLGRTLQIVLFATGSHNLSELRAGKIRRRDL